MMISNYFRSWLSSLGLAIVFHVFPTPRQIESAKDQVLPGDDVAVYSAVLANKIRPEVDRMAGQKIPTPAPLLVYDRTLHICQPPADPQRPMGCITDEDLQRFQSKSARAQKFMFEGLLNGPSREELAKVFRARNRESQPFPSAKLDAVIATSPEDYSEAIHRESNRTVGIASFSSPAYSTDGRALVEARYICGGLCGYGWFVLLERRGEKWTVLADELLFIS